MRISRQMLGVAAASILGLTTQLHAQSVLFSGEAFGCFKGAFVQTVSCPSPLAHPGADEVVNDYGLQYASSLFSVSVPAGGAASIGSAGNSFGRFSYASTPVPPGGSYNGGLFDLSLFFSTPPGVPTTTFSATITGNISVEGGFMHIQFPTNEIQFQIPGYFVTVDVQKDVFPGLNGPGIDISGAVSITSSPEPGTYALFATGLVGLIPLARRRKASKRA